MTEDELNRQRGLIQAVWAIDSETSREYLIDVYTHEVIAERIKGKIVDPGESNVRKD